jgi:hypothetical protein
MIRVKDVILSEDIATAKFACDITKCKGACCVVGDAGAPVNRDEIPVLNKAFKHLRSKLTEKAQRVAEQDGVVQGDGQNGFQISCVDTGECIFVEKMENGVATCAIQNACYRGEFNWEKPISCHLYPIRLKKIAGFEYANFEYIPSLCSAGCENGENQGIRLYEFLEKSLTRRYGEAWYEELKKTCEIVIAEDK